MKGREDKTRPSSSPGHLLTKHHNTDQLTKWLPSSLSPCNASSFLLFFFPVTLTNLFLCSVLLYFSLHLLIYKPSAIVGEATSCLMGPGAKSQWRHARGMGWPYGLCVCACVPRLGWMAFVGTSAVLPSHQLSTHTHTHTHRCT